MDARLCPKCGRNEVAPRCRICDDCAGARDDDRPVVVAMQSPDAKKLVGVIPAGYDFDDQLATLRAAMDEGLVSKREAQRLGSMLLVAFCPDAFSGAVLG